MIEPSNGRIVWYRPAPAEEQLPGYGLKPWAAMVTHVWNDRLVNLTVFPPDGSTHAQRNVILLQDDDAKPDDQRFAQWMPYQKGQALTLAQMASAAPGAPAPPSDPQSTLTEAVNRLLLPLQTLADFAVKAMAESDQENAEDQARRTEAGLT